MWRWVPYPFLRITPVFMAGILTGYYIPLPFSQGFYLTLLLLYPVLVVCTPRRYLFYISLPAGLMGLTLVFLTGFFLIQEKQENKSPHHLAHISEPYAYYTATVVEQPQRRDQVFRTVVSVNSLIRTDSLHHISANTFAEGKVMLYQPVKDSLSLLQYGDLILIKGRPQPVQPPANPHEFDYRKYLAQQNIYHQHYISAPDFVLYGHHTPSSLLAFSSNLREKSKSILLQSIPEREAAGVALALTLGTKDYLDNAIRHSYAATGAMHVLAVSGLHVGIIYLVLSLLLKPLVYMAHVGRWLKAGICIGVLWMYALLAGCSPSVLRAATMFTFIIIAGTFRWQTNIYNTLATSAFFLLCYDPLLLFSVGFQLSYLAVTGIIYLQPKIYRWFEFNTWLPDKLWSLTSVSLAAQLATFPIALYYFHQFPVYFWLSNLLVIPAAFVILSLSLFTIMTGLLVPVGVAFPGWVLGKFIVLINLGITAIESLPANTWEDIAIDLPQMLLIYGVLIFILLLLHHRRFPYVIYAFGCIALLTALRFHHFYCQNQEKSITFYSINQQSNVDFTTGITNFHLGEYNDKAKYHISPNHIQAGLLTAFVVPGKEAKTGKMAIHKLYNLLFCVWQGQKIIFIKEPFEPQTVFNEKMKVDMLVICNNSVKKLAQLPSGLDFSLLVIDSSNATYLTQKLADEADKLKIPYHAVSRQGAFTIHLPD